MRYTCMYGNSREVSERFLRFPRELYDRKTYVQDIGQERKLLAGTHVLSHYFTFLPIIALDENRRTAGRCALTLYEGDEAGYVGFFECSEDPDASRALLTETGRLAEKSGRTRLTGPLNASFWIGYRMKRNHFSEVYTAEPYNKEYYFRQWADAGFTVTDRYVSNALRVPAPEDSSLKCRQRLEMIRGKGYRIKSPDRAEFDEKLREIFRLLVRVYARFPMFKEIGEDEFCALFGSLKYVLDLDMVKLVYHGKDLAGFFVCVPDYGNLTHHRITPTDLLRILRIRYARRKRYVLLYLGIDPAYPGLGAALAELVKEELVRRKAPSVGALIHEGKITARFYEELMTDQYEYVLMEKKL